MTRELTPLDVAALDLLAQAREARDDQIASAVERIRINNESQERALTLASLLAGEVTQLQEQIVQLGKRWRLGRLIGRGAIKVTKGPNLHLPLVGRATYPLTSPLLLTTAAEMIDDARLKDGYLFTVYRRPKKDPTLPRVIITHQTLDLLSGKSTSKDLYDIEVFEDEAGKYAALYGPAIQEIKQDVIHHWVTENFRSAQREKNKTIRDGELAQSLSDMLDYIKRFGCSPQDYNDEQYEFPLGLVIGANRELSRR